MKLDWTRLRSNGNIEVMFENLCAQLAELEKPQDALEFFKRDAPDGGIDCGWKLKGSKIHAWQAKFFNDVLGDSQWRQIDDSIKSAIENWDNLTTYTICIPKNLSGKVKRGKSGDEKWYECKEKWKKIKPNVELNLWGDYKLTQLINKENFSGSRKYFFDELELTNEWFARHSDDVKEALGLRYSEKINVKLPIIKHFDALCKTNIFLEDITILLNSIESRLKNCDVRSTELKLNFKSYFNDINNLIDDISTINSETNKKIGISDMIKNLELLVKNLHEFSNNIYKNCPIEPEESPYEGIALCPPNIVDAKLKQLDNSFYYLFEELHELKNKLETSLPADTRQLVIKGDAGSGKSHLFCDVLIERNKHHQPTILLLGQRFRDEPFNEMISQLKLPNSCGFDEFLQALNSHAKITKNRALILIDALNEGDNKKIWSEYLSEFRQNVLRYDYINLGFSVRTNFIEWAQLDLDGCTIITHNGFEDKPEKYSDEILKKNSINAPNIFFLKKEFSNPQFLILLCKAIKDKKNKNINENSISLLKLYKLFLNRINSNLSKILDYDIREKLVEKATKYIVQQMYKKNTLELCYDDVSSYLKTLHPSDKYSKSLLRELILSGLLLEDYSRTDEEHNLNDTSEKISIRFSYEKLAEHLLVDTCMKNMKSEDIMKSFEGNGVFSKYFIGEDYYANNFGVIDAILIQIPDKYNIEPYKILENSSIDHTLLIDPLLTSIVYRNSDNIHKNILTILFDHYMSNKHMDKFFNSILRLSIKSNDDVNAEYVHNILLDMKMPDRDKIWSHFLHKSYDSKTIIYKYIAWPLNNNPKNIPKYVSCRLVLILCWTLTSSNKLIQDNATASIIELMRDKGNMWINILKKFEKCDDLYLQERLYAITYAIILKNSANQTLIEQISLYVYSTIFSVDPPESIFIRDYARSIIHYALTVIPDLKIDKSKIEPPYISTNVIFPTTNILNNEIKHLQSKNISNEYYENLKHVECLLNNPKNFFNDTMTYGIKKFPWANIKLKKRISINDVKNEFYKNLSDDEKSLFVRYTGVMWQEREYLIHNKIKDSTIIQKSKKELQNGLSKNNLKIFEDVIDAYLVKIYSCETNNKENFTENEIINWISNRVIKFYQNSKYFKNDQSTSPHYYDPSDQKYEPIWKKYLYVAYYELLAKISDRYELKNFNTGEYQKYLGTWQLPGIRKFDPTWIRKKHDLNSIEILSKEWFPNITGNDNTIDVDKWNRMKKHALDITKILDIEDPINGNNWILLQGNYEKGIKIKKNNLSKENCILHFKIDGYICNKKNMDKIFTDMADSNNSYINYSISSTDTFLGELFWHESLHELHNRNVRWINSNEQSEIVPNNSYPVAYGLMRENIFIMNLKPNMDLLLPNKLLVEKMQLKNDMNGRFLNNKGDVISFNVDLVSDAPSLLIRKDVFSEFLAKNDYALVWNISGEVRCPIGEESYDFEVTHIGGRYHMMSKDVVGTIHYNIDHYTEPQKRKFNRWNNNRSD